MQQHITPEVWEEAEEEESKVAGKEIQVWRQNDDLVLWLCPSPSIAKYQYACWEVETKNK